MSTQQTKRAKRKVGEILLSQGYINQQQLDHALEQHQPPASAWARCW